MTTNRIATAAEPPAESPIASYRRMFGYVNGTIWFADGCSLPEAIARQEAVHAQVIADREAEIALYEAELALRRKQCDRLQEQHNAYHQAIARMQ
jgi:hypothetical protein